MDTHKLDWRIVTTNHDENSGKFYGAGGVPQVQESLGCENGEILSD
jgi:hypothetical protein